MQFSLEKIRTVAGCDTLLAAAQKRKQNLERKRRNLGESIDTFSNRLDQIAKDSATVQSILEVFTTAYHALPEGKDKVSMNVELKRVELRKARLEKKSFTCNVRALLLKQVRYNKLDNQVAAIESYIIAVQNKKTVLGNLSRTFQPSAPSRATVVRQKSRPEKTVYKPEADFRQPTPPIASAEVVLRTEGSANAKWPSVSYQRPQPKVSPAVFRRIKSRRIEKLSATPASQVNFQPIKMMPTRK